MIEPVTDPADAVNNNNSGTGTLGPANTNLIPAQDNMDLPKRQAAESVPVAEGPTQPVRHSRRGHILSRQYLENEEYENREQTALAKGEDWATDSTMVDQPLTLIVQTLYLFVATSGELWVPQAYKQAMKHHPDLWREPMDREYKMLMEKRCWELVPLPPNANLTGKRWTYTLKFNNY
ncbi:hypothetical protein F5051DRAFT_439809 [Lentinula edodes]|nr:hypothetical protein F5051DRAFT_439809 [Lentinula edodes]